MIFKWYNILNPPRLPLNHHLNPDLKVSIRVKRSPNWADIDPRLKAEVPHGM